MEIRKKSDDLLKTISSGKKMDYSLTYSFIYNLTSDPGGKRAGQLNPEFFQSVLSTENFNGYLFIYAI